MRSFGKRLPVNSRSVISIIIIKIQIAHVIHVVILQYLDLRLFILIFWILTWRKGPLRKLPCLLGVLFGCSPSLDLNVEILNSDAGWCGRIHNLLNWSQKWTVITLNIEVWTYLHWGTWIGAELTGLVRQNRHKLVDTWIQITAFEGRRKLTKLFWASKVPGLFM